MFRAHALIIMRTKLHYTASGIITPVGVIICVFVLLLLRIFRLLCIFNLIGWEVVGRVTFVRARLY